MRCRNVYAAECAAGSLDVVRSASRDALNALVSGVPEDCILLSRWLLCIGNASRLLKFVPVRDAAAGECVAYTGVLVHRCRMRSQAFWKRCFRLLRTARRAARAERRIKTGELCARVSATRARASVGSSVLVCVHSNSKRVTSVAGGVVCKATGVWGPCSRWSLPFR